MHSDHHSISEHGPYRVSEAADIAECSIETIRRHIRAGNLEAVKYKRELLITPEALNAFMQRRSMSLSQRIDGMIEQLADFSSHLTSEQQLKLCSILPLRLSK